MATYFESITGTGRDVGRVTAAILRGEVWQDGLPIRHGDGRDHPTKWRWNQKADHRINTSGNVKDLHPTIEHLAGTTRPGSRVIGASYRNNRRKGTTCGSRHGNGGQRCCAKEQPERSIYIPLLEQLFCFKNETRAPRHDLSQTIHDYATDISRTIRRIHGPLTRCRGYRIRGTGQNIPHHTHVYDRNCESAGTIIHMQNKVGL